MKKALLLLALLPLLCVFGTVFAVKQMNTHALRLYLQTTCEQISGKPLVLEEDVEISLLPLGVRFGKASWGLVEGQPAPTGLSLAVEGGLLRLEMLPLFSGKLKITQVHLHSPRVHLKPDTAAAPSPAPASPPVPGHGANGQTAWQFPPVTLDALRIDEGVFILYDQRNPVARKLRAYKLNITATGLAPGASATVHADGLYSHAWPTVRGSFMLDTLLRLDGTTLHCEQTHLTLARSLGAVPLPPGKNVRFNADISANLAAPQHIRIGAIHGAMGDVDYTGEVNVALTEPTRITGQLALGTVNVNSLLAASQANALPPKRKKTPATPAVGTPGKPAAAPAAKAPGKPAAKPKAAAAFPALDLRLRIGKLLYDGLSLVNLEGHITSPGGAQALVRPLRASLGTGGTLEGHGTLDLPRQHWRAQGQARNVAMGPVVQAITGARSLDGTASLDWDMQGRGFSARLARRTLGGSGKFSLSTARVHSLPQSLRLITGKDDVHLERVSVPFKAQNGVITLPDIRLNGSAGGVTLNATGQGTLRLPDERVHVALDIHAGGVHIPALISGTLGNLTCGVDPAKAASTLLHAPDILKNGPHNAGNALHKMGKGALRMFLGR